MNAGVRDPSCGSQYNRGPRLWLSSEAIVLQSAIKTLVEYLRKHASRRKTLRGEEHREDEERGYHLSARVVVLRIHVQTADNRRAMHDPEHTVPREQTR